MATKKAPAKTTKVARTDTPHEVARVGEDAPSWLAEVDEHEETGLEVMAEYRVIPRIKVIQSMTDRELKNEFGEGALVAMPGRVLLAAEDEALQVVPVFAFTEFCTWSDLKDQGSPTILARSFDKAGEIAAKSRDPNRRHEPYGDVDKKTGEPTYEMRHVEHLCFGCVVYDEDHPMNGQPVVLSFQRGEFGTGKNFITALMMRRFNGHVVPIWGQVWQLKSGFRDRGVDAKWFGIDYEPGDPPFIASEHVDTFRTFYNDLKHDFENQRLMVDRNEADAEEAGASTDDLSDVEL